MARIGWSMSMTIRRAIWAVPLVLLVWLAVMVGVTRFTDAAPGALVLLPPRDLIAQLPNGAGVVGRTGVSLTLASGQPGLAETLYEAGAWLVLPAGLTGCLPLPRNSSPA